MKITRQNDIEKFNTTVDWIKTFEASILKKADFLNNFKPSNQFKTIDEKMADIKNRVGFGLIKSTEDSTTVKKEANQTCSCPPGQKCNCASDKENPSKNEDFNQESEADRMAEDSKKEIRTKLNNFIKYVIDYKKDRPSASLNAIIAACKDDPALSWDSIKRNVNEKALFELIKEKIGNDKKTTEEYKYTPVDTTDKMNNPQDMMADYMRHSMPER